VEDTVSNIQTIQPAEIKAGTKLKGVSTGKDFNQFLGAVEAFGPASAEATHQYGSVSSGAVLSSAFSGVSASRSQMAPSYAFGGAPLPGSTPYGMSPMKAGGVLPPGSGTFVDNTTPGFSTGELMSSMHQNNLNLMQLQAMMQSNMQEWNTKSNILSADHRARMAMIEKFTARG